MMMPASNKSWTVNPPSFWETDRIKDCVASIVGGDWGDDPNSDAKGEDIIVLRVADFEKGTVKHEGLTLRKIKESKIPHRLVNERSLLIEKSGGGEKQWVGRVVYPGKLPFPAICSNFIGKLDLLPSFDPLFFNFLFSALYDSAANRPHVRQTTGIQNLSIPHFLNTYISIPPLPEQKLIASYLATSCETIDRAIEAKQKQLETLDVMQKSIVQKAVTQGMTPTEEMEESELKMLDRIPPNWRVCRLKALSEIRYGLGQPPPQKDDGVPIIRATNVTRGKVTPRGLIRVDPDEIPASRNAYLKAGEIIVVRSGAYTADSAIIPKQWEGSVAGYDMVVTATHADPRYLAYAFLSDYVLRDQLLLMTLRAAQPHLNANQLGSVRIVIPKEVSEQAAICDYLDRRMKEFESLVKNIEDQVAVLCRFRKSLIHECVTGKRRISEADVKEVQSHV